VGIGVIRVPGFRNGNNVVTISLTHLDRVARCVPVNRRRDDAESTFDLSARVFGQTYPCDP
jgi:hypothetical protein